MDVPCSNWHICWPLASPFPSLVEYGVLQSSLSAAFTSVHQPWPEALRPEYGEMPVYSQGPPLLLTFDAALHLCLVLLTFPPVPAADTAYTVYKAAAGPPLQPPRLLWSGLWVGHWGCSSSVPSKRGHFLSLFAKRMVLVYPF